MGLREKLNKSPKASAALGVVLFVASVGLVVWSLREDRAAAPSAVQAKEWYTSDDGATWFADEVGKQAPFQTADGKTAVKAAVFKCKHGKTFVGYMERMNPDARKEASKPQKDEKGNPYANYFGVSQSGLQCKRPKDPTWISVSDPAVSKVVTPVCPEGSTDGIEPVLP